MAALNDETLRPKGKRGREKEEKKQFLFYQYKSEENGRGVNRAERREKRKSTDFCGKKRDHACTVGEGGRGGKRRRKKERLLKISSSPPPLLL